MEKRDSDRSTVTKPGPTETSQEGLFNSLFTGLLIAALEGGGAIFVGMFPQIRLDRSWEHTEGNDPENVKKFDMLKLLGNGRLLHTEDGLDLYYVAMKAKKVRLTELGRLYWRLAKKGFIWMFSTHHRTTGYLV